MTGTNKPAISINLIPFQGGTKVFQKIRIQVEIEEIKYTKIQSLLQKEKVNPNDIKFMFEQMINNQFRRTNNIRG